MTRSDGPATRRAARRASRSIAIRGTTPEPPPIEERRRRSPSHTNQPPIGPRTSSVSPTSSSSCRNVETSPSGSRSTVSSIDGAVVRRRRDRVRALRAVAVGRGEPDDEVLAGEVRRRDAARASANVLTRRGLRPDRRDRRVSATDRSAGRRRWPSVTSLSRPGSAARARGRHGRGSRATSQNPGSSWSSTRESGDPLGALPEVEVRDEQAGRAAVVAGQRRAVDLPTRPTPCPRSRRRAGGWWCSRCARYASTCVADRERTRDLEQRVDRDADPNACRTSTTSSRSGWRRRRSPGGSACISSHVHVVGARRGPRP